jgi:hypothetical protein
MKVINISIDNAEKMVLKHQFLLKEALSAAAYHQDQIDMLSKAVKDVTSQPSGSTVTETTVSLGGSDAGSTGEPASAANPAQTVTGDGQPVRKDALVEVLKTHEQQYGKFDIDAETIAKFILAQ